MSIWGTDFYESANDYTAISLKKWQEGEIASSWDYAISARLAYICDAIINLVILPFAIIGVTLGACYALLTCNLKAPLFKLTRSLISEKTNHLFLSLCGSFISPSIAHKYRDANLVPYLIAIRITLLTVGLIYYCCSQYKKS